MIRRELPLTTHASPAKGLSQTSGGGFSFVLAPLAAADLVLELKCGLFKVFAFSLVGKVFAFVLHAAIGCVESCSALMAIAQINPSSSRPTAVITFL